MPYAFDPLKIYYIVLMNDDQMEDASPFQGFFPSWRHCDWAMQMLVTLPADVLEGTHGLEGIISQRMGGWRRLSWIPLSAAVLDQIDADDLGFFLVVFTSQDAVAARAAAWIEAQGKPVLHFSTRDVAGAMGPELATTGEVVNYCRAVMASRGDELDEARRAAARDSLARWVDPEPIPTRIRAAAHNVTIPNYMALWRAGRSLEDGEAFIGRNAAEYDSAILESARAVLAVREQVGLREQHRMTLVHPEVYLTEPALYRTHYRSRHRSPELDRAANAVLRMLQQQTDFKNDVNGEVMQGILASPAAKALISMRGQELRTFTHGTGLAAAQTTSATIRMSPAVNRVFPTLSAYARSVRAESRESARKARRLFKSIQDELLRAVGERRMAFLESEISGPIKIVADAPIEWLPIKGLPLLLRHQCSRLSATPGNLLMGLLTGHDSVTLRPADVQRVLVINAFTDDDPLRNHLRGALEAIAGSWEHRMTIEHRTVRDETEFVAALNEFDGHVMVFDGHGTLDAGDGVGSIIIGRDPVDVWDLRGRVRVPPIVLLSACDTHGLDSPSHATAGNGFLAIGAVTVLATMLPISGLGAAMFVARMVYRLADFIPAALRAAERVLNWTEIVGGMQRMFFASELLEELVGPPTPKGSTRYAMQLDANLDINTGEKEWYENLLERVAAFRNESLQAVKARAEHAIARCESIRYIQLGHPETILIDDGTIRRRFVPDEVAEAFGRDYDPAPRRRRRS